MTKYFRTALLAMLFGLLAGLAHAQTVTVTTKASWTQPNTLADAQTFTYKLADGSALPVAITGVVCSIPIPAVVSCTGTIPQPASGSHSFVVIASNADGSMQAVSIPLVGIMPGSPTSPKVTVTVTIS